MIFIKMSKTPNQVSLSSSLKERLKKCGRYHASPEPVARQSKRSVTTLDQEKTQNDAHFMQEPVLPKVKRPCLSGSLSNLKSVKELSNINYKSELQTKQHADSFSEEKLVEETVTRSTDKCSLDQTPVTQRSRSSVTKMKVNKLNFEEASEENKTKEKNDTKDKNMKNFKQDLEENLVQSDHELPSVSKSRLLKELETKEEQLRKLRMVKMYRSKNNLEELQGLIDKWRDVSQQALQDLHSAMPEPRPSLTQLINHLGIDHQLLHFSAEEDESFF